MIKAFISDPRCLTLSICNELVSVSEPDRFKADIFILFQDYLNIEEQYMDEALEHGIPVLVIQHGRQATRDYSKKGRVLRADKICLWGQIDLKRMQGLGYPDKSLVITGSPLLEDMGERYKTELLFKKQALFFSPKYAPYLTTPNFMILDELLRTPYNIFIKTISDDRNLSIYENYVTRYPERLTIVATSPKGRAVDHYNQLVESLKSSILFVGVEESINELMAEALDIPVIMVTDAWIPKNELHFNGKKDIKKDGLVYSRAVYKTELTGLFQKIKDVEVDDTLRCERKQVAIEEGGLGLPTATLIMDQINNLVKEKSN